MDINRFKELPLMGILRGISSDIIEPLTETIISSGLKTVEITMNTPGASELIKQMLKVAGGRLMIGAGTVLTKDDLHSALNSGASFIVLPTTIPDIVKYCLKHKIPVFPGALSPQEIYGAWSFKPTMVKVFPAKFFGPGYIKEIKGPFGNIELLACGGVNKDNIKEFFFCGASAVAFGGSVFKKEWLSAHEFSLIEEQIKALIAGFEL